MSARPIIWVSLATKYGTVTVTGKDIDEIVREAVPDARRYGRKWIIRADQVSDLATLADHLGAVFRERR
ncbi:hypothetical protein ACFV9C_23305 [Kribbella sp. NPDC059898]|uniref:hypothetical protein n=1 Tax=Kribbella sp. NPDC059898 TaxID=3346995 RepID=UPI00364BA5D7